MKTKSMLLKGGRVLDPVRGIDQLLDIRVEDGAIAAVGASLQPGEGRVVDAAGWWVLPGCMDMHVHLRSPGRPDEETIESGLLGAARGGFTDVACMPNTEPALDHPMLITALLSEAARCGHARLHPIAAATRGRKGESPSDYSALFGAGAVAVSDDGSPVQDAAVARRCLELLHGLGRVLIEHSEDMALSAGGVMHEGRVSLELGRRGVSAASEDLCTERDIILSRLTGGRVHIAHVSTAGTVAAIRRARAEGLPITGETAPHYFWFTDEDAAGPDGTFRVSPPLRSLVHQEALIEGVKDGTLTALATDHAPHSPEEKAEPFSMAPPGFLGLETALAASHGALVVPGHIAPLHWATLWTRGPREALGLRQPAIEAGAPADLTLFDPQSRWKVDAWSFASRSRNSPFHGLDMTGRPAMTLLAGRVTHENAPRARAAFR